jgi:uncharacterized RDD family membrane protein YckC
MSEMLDNEMAEAAPLQELAAERLAAHRRRRYGFELPAAVGATSEPDAAAQERCGLPAGASRVREAVAERYKHSVSYREFLAAEAERAVAQAQAQVEIATRNVAAVAAAQTKLMEELELWPVQETVAAASVGRSEAVQVLPQPTIVASTSTTDWTQVTRQTAGHAAFYPDEKQMKTKPNAAVMSAAAVAALPGTTPTNKERLPEAPGLRVRLHEPVPATAATLPRPRVAVPSEEAEVELQSLDEEIAFRAAPEFEEHLLEPLTIQPNILEFPRQLVAARRARPKLADGPSQAASPQLRIFEVETAAISVQPEVAAAAAPEWQSVVLDAPVRERVALPVAKETAVKPELRHMAPVMLRMAALVIDACWIGLAFVGLVCGAMKMMATVPHLSPKQMVIGAAVSLLTLALVYGLVFLSLAGATPGMMYAEIGLYQFDTTDARPGTLRLWLLLTLLSALPAGLGLLWPVVDPDGLGWQDRVCGVYPRLV